MDVHPRTAAAGGTVTVTRGLKEIRGPSYNFLGQVDGQWTLLYVLYPHPDCARASVRQVPRDGDGGEPIYEFAIAVRGGAPEEVPIPADVPPGDYRIAAVESYVDITIEGPPGG